MKWRTIITAGAMISFAGITPASEEICDGLKGGTPGLYGRCVSYCSDQESDSSQKNRAAILASKKRRPPSSAGEARIV